MLRHSIHLVELIDEAVKCSVLTQSEDLPPILVILVVLDILYLLVGEEWVILVGGLDEYAIRLRLYLLLNPANA